MKKSEFNAKYAEYLKQGAYGLDIDNEFVVELLDKEFQELIKIPEFSYSQIKIKFGTARVYIFPISIDRTVIEEKIDKLLSNSIL